MKTVISKSQRVVRNNSTTILASIGVSGVVTTAYLAAKAGYQSAFDLITAQSEQNEQLTPKEKTVVVWKLYIPAGISGALTIGCVIASTRVGAKRTAAMAAAYSLSEQAFREYKEKVVEQIGEKKEEAIRDEIAAERVTRQPPKDVVIVDAGKVLCCELYTGRYFHSDMESLRRAVNQLNQRVVANTYAYLSDFYDILELDHTSASDYFGWEADKLLELEFSTAIATGGQPCITFDYSYLKPM